MRTFITYTGWAGDGHVMVEEGRHTSLDGEPLKLVFGGSADVGPQPTPPGWIEVESLADLEAACAAREALGHELWRKPTGHPRLPFPRQGRSAIGFDDRTAGEVVFLKMSKMGNMLDELLRPLPSGLPYELTPSEADARLGEELWGHVGDEYGYGGPGRADPDFADWYEAVLAAKP